ncbi:hypothetical protein PVAP13_8KG224804 [Panicum virgatum]|uniref:Uncharacterized protein n=1 Tax=Panicum virgatum TaxID=38727 RepID=A0A8T0PRM1_PANVG|nr:hypothetical protein PVAP13_8KG224804 [Panicum virgatum]
MLQQVHLLQMRNTNSLEKEMGARLRKTGLSTLPAAVRAGLTADLIDDPQLIPEKLKVLQDNLKSCYKFATEMAN